MRRITHEEKKVKVNPGHGRADAGLPGIFDWLI